MSLYDPLCLYDDKYKKIRVICAKCNDVFILSYGGKSHRCPCRYHNFDKNDFCIDCNRHKKHIMSSNCYHIRKTPLCCFGGCTIS